MQTKMTRPLILIGSLALCFLIANLTLNHLLSEERLRLMLIEPAENQLGRKVDIGAINVSLFSGINIEKIAIRGKNQSNDFLTIETFRLRYQLLPLLQKKLVLTEILIERPELHLSRNAKGDFNFADLSLKPKKITKENLPPDEQGIDPLPLDLVFEKIAINNFNLTFTDQTGELPKITNSKGDLTLSLALAKNLVDSRYNGTLSLIANADYNSQKPVLIMTCNLNEQQVSFKGDLSVGFEKVSFNGQLASLLTSPNLTLNLQSNSLDLAKLASLKAVGEKPPPAPASEPAPAVAAPTEASKFRAHGQVTIANLQHGKLALRKLNLAYAFEDKQLALNEISAELFGGQITGQLQADLGQPAPAFQGQLSASELRMAEAMASLDQPAGYLSGALAADLAFTGSGRGWPEIRTSLDGEGKFSLVKGGLASSPYSQALATLLDLPELNELNFDELAGTLQIAGGRIALLCTMTSRELDLQTKGSAGLDGSLDLPLTIQLSRENSQRFLKQSKYAGYLADESGRTTLNLKMTGTTSQPKLTLDSSGTGKQVKKVLEKKASEELGRAITKKLGGAGNEQQKEVVEDLSNRFLKQLLNN